MTARSSPVLVAAPAGVTFAAVSVGGYGAYTCATTAAGAAYCWGNNGYGQLGDGTTTNPSSPVLVAGGLRFAAVSAGGWETCGVTTAGVAFCWGDNDVGQLGDSTTTNRSSPVRVAAPAGVRFVAVSVGYGKRVSSGNGHTCGLTAAGAVYCWGYGSFGALGDGTTTTFRTSPVLVAGSVSFATVGVGGNHTCGVTAAGAAYCWGYNGSGELGDGTTTNRSSPVRVVGSGP